MNYLDSVMNRLTTMLHNVSQNPNAENCNLMLDSVKRILKEYEEDTGKNLRITDYRKTR